MLVTLIALFWSSTVLSHELSMADLNMHEFGQGQLYWSWSSSGAAPVSDEVTPLWPDNCYDVDQQLSCEGGLRGEVKIEGIGENYSAVVMRIRWLDGQSSVYTLTQTHPSVRLMGSAQDSRSGGEIASTYTVLGIEHILGGIDHLLFVVCLLFLVGFNRRLVWTITAFTIAHSLTLAGSLLGFISLSPDPVEVVIALSILLAAREALSRKITLTREWPVLVAFIFGLVHGLGFAGVLEEIGLPAHHFLLALATFNLGVELGQLMIVLVAFALVKLTSRLQWVPPARVPALYMIGALAAFWSFERVATILA
jgi:hydrogenase/urease accessory protein HupE